MNPYLFTTIVYAALAVLAALDAALANFGLVTWFNGLRWLRIHFITLGLLTQMLFAVMPALAARHAQTNKRKPRWDIWLVLNAGLLILLVGIPLVHGELVFTGGTLIFIATIMMISELQSIRSQAKPTDNLEGPSESRKFYIASLSYFLLGIIIGTGLWIGWSEALRIQVPIEVHIHANNWGFMSLAFAGLLIDLYPKVTGKSFAWPDSINTIFWMMTLGAFGLVLGPWFNSLAFSVPGLILHLSATIWLILNVALPLVEDRTARSTGMKHIITSYLWILAPVLVAPLIILKVPGFPGTGIEASAPQALIYGWVLQFGYALLPYFFRRVFLPEQEPRLGGNTFSLVTVHLGGIFLWVGIFIKDYQGVLHGTAYALWFISLVPIAYELWKITLSGLASLPTYQDEIAN